MEPLRNTLLTILLISALCNIYPDRQVKDFGLTGCVLGFFGSLILWMVEKYIGS